MGRGKGCRRRHRSGGGSPASRDADGRGLHSAAQRTSNRAGRWQADGPPQQKLARRHDHPRVIAGAFNPRSRCARSPRPTRGGGGWQGGRHRSGPVTLVAGQSFSATKLYSLLSSSRPLQRRHALRSIRTRMQTATSETESKSRDLSICVHHYTLRAPCPKGQEINYLH